MVGVQYKVSHQIPASDLKHQRSCSRRYRQLASCRTSRRKKSSPLSTGHLYPCSTLLKDRFSFLSIFSQRFSRILTWRRFSMSSDFHKMHEFHPPQFPGSVNHSSYTFCNADASRRQTPSAKQPRGLKPNP